MSIYQNCCTDQKKIEQVNIFTFLWSFFIKQVLFGQLLRHIWPRQSLPPYPHPFLSRPDHLWRSHSCTIVFDYHEEGSEHRITISLLLIYKFLFVLLISLSFCGDIWTMFLFKKYWLFFKTKFWKWSLIFFA